MSKEINKLMPDLRFPEFKNDGEWDSTTLDDLCELITKGTTPTTLGYSYTESGVNFIKIESILDGNINLQKAAFISNECNEALKRSQLNENDILFSIAGALGVVTTVNKEILPANTNQALSIVRLKNKKQKDYVKAFLKSNIITTEIEKIKAGAAQPNISLSQVANFKILIPKSPKEQQKIASCLSSLDEVITAHSQKLDLLKDHKKGLMQNLFPQEGEKVPKYRFKEFVGDGEWVEKSLDKVVNNFIVPMRDKPKKLDGEIPWCRIEDFNGIYLSESKSNQGVSLETVTEMNLKIYPTNTLLVSCSADLGRCAITQKPLITNQTFIGLVIDEKKMNSLFLYYIMTNSRKELNARSSGTTISYLSRQQFEQFAILLPPQKDKKEQQKIASCLASLDTLITAQTEKIEQLRLHKKGLMQCLFPKINE